MKRCQSQLVSYKVQWFCSLAGFSWWSALLLFCPSSLPLQMLFPAVLFFFFVLLIPFLKSREKAVVLRARRCGLLYYSQLQLRVCRPSTCSGGRNQQTLRPLLSLTAEQYTICICCYFATIFILFLIFLQPKKTWVVSVLSSRAQTARLAG